MRKAQTYCGLVHQTELVCDISLEKGRLSHSEKEGEMREKGRQWKKQKRRRNKKGCKVLGLGINSNRNFGKKRYRNIIFHTKAYPLSPSRITFKRVRLEYILRDILHTILNLLLLCLKFVFEFSEVCFMRKCRETTHVPFAQYDHDRRKWRVSLKVEVRKHEIH